MKRIFSQSVVRSVVAVSVAASALMTSQTASAAEGEESAAPGAVAETPAGEASTSAAASDATASASDATAANAAANPAVDVVAADAAATGSDSAAATSETGAASETKGDASVNVAMPVAPSRDLGQAAGFVAPDLSSDRDRVGAGSNESLRVGAMVGVGFPRPLAVEGVVKIREVVALGAEYSFMPTMTLAGAETSFKGMAVDARVFPFKNALFIGVRGGRQWLEARMTMSGRGVSSTESIEAATWFINPRIGVLHTWKSGVTVGIDAGVQIPVSPSFTRSGAAADAGLSGEADRQMAAVANVLGNKTTPTIDLLRVGFLF